MPFSRTALVVAALVAFLLSSQPAASAPSRSAPAPLHHGVVGSGAEANPRPVRIGSTPAPAVLQVARPVRRVATERPRPAPPVAPVTRYGAGAVQMLIRSAFGTQAPGALCVADHESGFNPAAENGQFRGVFQLGRVWYSGVWHFDPFDAALNVHYAFLLYERDGWSPWTTAAGCGL